eukprot:1141577-Pelagomonas_calceolata.AAC.2
MGPLHYKNKEQKRLVGMWRLARNTRLENLAVRSVLIFDCASCGSKFMGTLYKRAHSLVARWQ